MEILTEEEKNELHNRPIKYEYTNFSKDQINLRKQIGYKLSCYFIQNNSYRSINDLYGKYPMWKYYKYNNIQIRIYNTCSDYNEDNPMIKVVSAYLDRNRKFNVNAKNIIDVLYWSDVDINYIKLTPTPGIYLDPLGFILTIKDEFTS